MNVSVQNGTNAGRRRIKPPAKPWTCPSCTTPLQHFWTTCPNDGTARPDPHA